MRHRAPAGRNGVEGRCAPWSTGAEQDWPIAGCRSVHDVGSDRLHHEEPCAPSPRMSSPMSQRQRRRPLTRYDHQKALQVLKQTPNAVLAILLLLTQGASAQPIPAPETAFLKLWSAIPNRAGWDPLVSPAFPSRWPPPNGTGKIVRYAFAIRIRPGVADGAEVAAPWGRSTLDGEGRLVVERLTTRLQPLGIQGVRPLSAVEITLLDQESAAAKLLLAGGGQARDGVVRDVIPGVALVDSRDGFPRPRAV